MWLALSSPFSSTPCLNPNSTLKDRISFLPLLYFSSSFSSKKLSLGVGRIRLSSNLRLMDTSSFSCSSSTSTGVTTTGTAEDKVEKNTDQQELQDLHSCTFLNATSGEELLLGIQKERESGRLPASVASGMEDLYHNYRKAVQLSGAPNAEEIILSNMSAVLDRVLLDVEDPFEFSPYHKAIREHFDYYMFGQNYIRPLVDFGNSYVGNVSLFHEMEQKLQLGHNVILMSNHQTEADPAVIALLLEKTTPDITENMIYVAGDRVLTDPLCKPFSMGRNLLCVYSKKHMNDIPELVEMKRRANTRSLKELALLLRHGSQIIWIAPSGGRDRPDPITKEWNPAPFDVSSVDNMQRLVEHAGVPGHIYPLAILCHDIMPPPAQVEKEIGEKRVISFHGVGISASPEITYRGVALGCESEEEVTDMDWIPASVFYMIDMILGLSYVAKHAYSMAFYNSVKEQYNVLKSAIYDKQGLNASKPSISLSQPWT